MLPLDYASDSEDEATSPGTQNTTRNEPAKQAQSAPAKKTPGKNGSTLGLALPAPKAKKPTAPKKIIVELPKLEKRASDSEEDDANDMPAAKKPRLGGKGGASALLSMLPAPKKSTLELHAPKRVLGGGKPGVVYSASSRSEAVSEQTITEPAPPVTVNESTTESATGEDTTTSLVPPSILLKGKVNTSGVNKTKPKEKLASDAVDFFSLGT